MLQHYTGRYCYIVEFIPRTTPVLDLKGKHIIDYYETGFPDPLTKYKPSEFSQGCPPVWGEFDCQILAKKKFPEQRDCMAKIIDIRNEHAFLRENIIKLESVYKRPPGYYMCAFNPIHTPTLVTTEQLETLKSSLS